MKYVTLFSYLEQRYRYVRSRSFASFFELITKKTVHKAIFIGEAEVKYRATSSKIIK
jgi:hypothetical protein